MKKIYLPGRSFILCSITASSLGATACVIEKIDAIIDEHGVTFTPSSTDIGDQTTGAWTDVNTSTTSTTSVGADSGSDDSGVESLGLSSSTTDTTGGIDEASGGSSTGDGSTGAPEASCGDGVIQQDETCDDGNEVTDDGCQQCARDSVIFISSEVYQGFALDGLFGADQRCRSLAAKAGLARSNTFMAWLSVAALSASDRLVHSRGRYVLTDGLAIARDWDELTSGSLLGQITLDENSTVKDTRVWTGTMADGSAAIPSDFCGNWDDNSGMLLHGGEGRSVQIDAGWSFFEEGVCYSENRIYCVEQ